MVGAIRIEYMALTDLLQRKAARNPKQHSPEIARSIARFGFNAPLLIDERTGRLVFGHGRIDNLLGLKHGGSAPPARIEARDGDWWVPVIRGVAFTSAQEAEAYLLADNRLTEVGGWQQDDLLARMLDEQRQLPDGLTGLGWSDAEVTDLLLAAAAANAPPPRDDPGPQVDRAEALQAKWNTALGQLWELGEHRLVCGDCTDAAMVKRVMGEASLGGLVTDPPYSSGGFTRGDRQATTGSKYGTIGSMDFAGDNKDQRSWISWCHMWLSIWLQYAKPGTPFALFIDWRQLPALTDAIQSAGWLWRGIAVWDKTEVARPQSGRFRPQCEFVVWGSAGPLSIIEGRPVYPGVIRQAVKSAEKIHQTQKPVEVSEWSLSMTDTGGIVADPFLGSGTTMVAAHRLGRRCFGCEIEPRYVAVCLQRLADMGLEPKLLDRA